MSKSTTQLNKKGTYYPELTRLKGRIREKNSSYRALSKLTGMAAPTFSRKINGIRSTFDCLEADIICGALNITEEELPYFFYPLICNNYTNTINADRIIP